MNVLYPKTLGSISCPLLVFGYQNVTHYGGFINSMLFLTFHVLKTNKQSCPSELIGFQTDDQIHDFEFM